MQTHDGISTPIFLFLAAGTVSILFTRFIFPVGERAGGKKCAEIYIIYPGQNGMGSPSGIQKRGVRTLYLRNVSQNKPAAAASTISSFGSGVQKKKSDPDLRRIGSGGEKKTLWLCLFHFLRGLDPNPFNLNRFLWAKGHKSNSGV